MKYKYLDKRIIIQSTSSPRNQVDLTEQNDG